MRIAHIAAAGLLAAAGIGLGQGVARAAEAPWGSDVTEPVALLGRLHRAAMHEVQLGELAQQSASKPEVRQYGADLASDFRGIDQRIRSLATGLGISDGRLQTSRGDNVVVLRQQSDAFSRLASEKGPAFDRDFWVTVADAQVRESDLLAATATREPALTDLVTEMSRLYDRSSRRALDVAQGKPAQPPADVDEQPPEEQTD
jgi:predicted outer membrane protein